MRCPRCGNDNPATNRFCGMCGATLLQAEPPVKAETPAVPARPFAVPSGQVPPTPSAPAAITPIATPSRAGAPFSEDVREPISSEVPAISGPSFLGLNDPPPAKRRRGSLSIDPGGAPGSRSLDYLLEDDDEPKSGGAWKFVLILIALALAVGFGYLRWKNQALPPWLGLSAHKPTATPSSDATDSNSAAGTNAPSAATSSSASATSPTDAAGAPSAPSTAPSSGSSSAASPSENPATTPAPANSQSSAPSQPQGTNAASAPAQANPTPANSTPAAGDAADPGNASGTGAASNPAAATDTAQPDSAPAKPAPKPRPAVAPVRVDQVAEARKYLYGQGAPQSCDRGLRLLKPLADQANPKAMIEMGALYSAGLCTPRDLPTAYRWFALALRKDPANQPLQGDLQKLWGEMTQPERQLAIKLSQ